MEEALREGEEIFSLFLKHNPIYVFFKDENIQSLRLNRNYEKMLNMPMDHILGKNMDELFPPDLAKSMVEDDLTVLRENKLVEVEEELNGRYYITTYQACYNGTAWLYYKGKKYEGAIRTWLKKLTELGVIAQ